MKLTFGLHLDYRQGPLLTSRAEEAVVGPKGLLGLLEVHLGLAGPPTPRAQRVASYLGQLLRCDDGHRFYSASLAVDQLGVASTLLEWRDEWRLAGWDGTAPLDAPKRISDMADIERGVTAATPPGEAERLERVETALKRRKVPIEGMDVIDDLGRFPARWQAVLNALPATYVTNQGAQANGTLGALQAAALRSLDAGTVEVIDDAADDDTVQIYQSESREAAHEWLSARCLAQQTDRIILCERDGSALDAVLRVTGAAACGFDESSTFRPALQAVGLALELLWTPVDVHRVIEFLAHPYGPFSRGARMRLARAYAQQPGFGSKAWEDAKVAIAAMRGGPELLKETAFWFEGLRWHRDAGAPLSEVLDRVRRVTHSLAALLGRERDDLPAIAAAVKQSADLISALEELELQGIGLLGPRHVEQILAQVATSGAANPFAFPEAQCWRSSTTSAVTALESADEVVWWMPSSPQLPAALPWAPNEVGALQTAGARLRDPALEMRELARDWLRPLLAAKSRFVLVLPPEGEEEHPVWQLVRRVLPSHRLESISDSFNAVSPLTEVAGDKPLPSLTRNFKVAVAVRSKREKQSYTSLSELFDNPAVAVLKDAADLHTSSLLSVAAEGRLLGTLAHRLLEKLFEVAGVLTWTEDQVHGWFHSNADALIEAEGAPLMMRGFGVALHKFKNTARDAAVALLAHLQEAGAKALETEVKLEGMLNEIPIVGTVDLLVTLNDSRRVVVDLKWAYGSIFAGILQAGTHLQLALYAALIEQRFGQPPVELAFFIFETRTLIATSSSVFPSAQVASPPKGATVQALLAQSQESWNWRTGQLTVGDIDVVDKSLGAIEEFQGPAGTFPVSFGGKWNNDFVALLGWKETQ